MKNYLWIFLLCIYPINLVGQQSSWTVKDRWVMRKSPQSKKHEKFFAVGLWNMPGYTLNAMESNPSLYRKEALSYLNQTSLYNLVYMPSGDVQDRYKRVEVTGAEGFYYALTAYQNTVPGVDIKHPESDYAKRQFVKNTVNEPTFVNLIDSLIHATIRQNGNADYIWAPIDEIVNGGGGAWSWHPTIGEQIYKRIKKQAKNTLVFTDLMGNGKANTHLFELEYLKQHKQMPQTPPYEALGSDAKIMKERPLLGFAKTYDGRPLYVNGTAYYVDYDIETLKELFYENIKLCAKNYSGCGDVFGINAFIDFNTYPVLAGVTVDAIKAGTGKDTPVWLFFDGNGYAKPANLSTNDFIKVLKSQIYTAIIHGATGILFWNDRTESPDVFNALEKVVKELEDNFPIFFMKTIASEANNNLHYMIKGDKKAKYLIASNTHKTEAVELDIPQISKRTLAPLEVIILPLN